MKPYSSKPYSLSVPLKSKSQKNRGVFEPQSAKSQFDHRKESAKKSQKKRGELNGGGCYMGAFPNFNLFRNVPFCPRLSSFVLLGSGTGTNRDKRGQTGTKTGHFGTNWETPPFSIYPPLDLLKIFWGVEENRSVSAFSKSRRFRDAKRIRPVFELGLAREGETLELETLYDELIQFLPRIRGCLLGIFFGRDPGMGLEVLFSCLAM